MTLVLGKGGMGRWEGDGEGGWMGRRQLDGNCDGEEVFEILLYTPPPFSVCEVVCILGEQVIILHTPPPLPVCSAYDNGRTSDIFRSIMKFDRSIVRMRGQDVWKKVGRWR